MINFPISFTISVTKVFPIKNIRILSETGIISPLDSYLCDVQLSGKSCSLSDSIGVKSLYRLLLKI